MRTVVGEVKQFWKLTSCAVGVARVLEPCIGVSELVEEWVSHCLHCRKSLSRRILQQLGDEINDVIVGFPENLEDISPGWPVDAIFVTNFIEWMGLDLRELVVHVVRVHRPDLISCRSPQHFDDFHKLINPRLPRKQRLAKHQLGHDTASGPNVCEAVSNVFSEMVENVWSQSSLPILVV